MIRTILKSVFLYSFFCAFSTQLQAMEVTSKTITLQNGTRLYISDDKYTDRQSIAILLNMTFYGTTGGLPCHFTDSEVALSSCLCAYLLNTEKPILVGTLLYAKNKNKENHYHIENSAVDPEYQNKGIGSALLHYFEQTVPCSTITLITLRAARAFYINHGFTQIPNTSDPNALVKRI